jgi:hypothetical protein
LWWVASKGDPVTVNFLSRGPIGRTNWSARGRCDTLVYLVLRVKVGCSRLLVDQIVLDSYVYITIIQHFIKKSSDFTVVFGSEIKVHLLIECFVRKLSFYPLLHSPKRFWTVRF